MDDRTGEELLNAYVLGDHQALSTLLQRYKDAHHSIACRRIYGDKELARDGVQEAWITISRKAASFRGESKLSTWMYQIVDRACIDLLRKTQVRPQLVESELDVENRVEVSEDFTENSVTKIRIYEALDQLPADQRDALIKVNMEGYSVEDAARTLGVAEGTVKSRCARGRAALAILLADLRPNNGEE
jgi:RNA polymerase sigma-70 factor (ECF subfamily)